MARDIPSLLQGLQQTHKNMAAVELWQAAYLPCRSHVVKHSLNSSSAGDAADMGVQLRRSRVAQAWTETAETAANVPWGRASHALRGVDGKLLKPQPRRRIKRERERRVKHRRKGGSGAGSSPGAYLDVPGVEEREVDHYRGGEWSGGDGRDESSRSVEGSSQTGRALLSALESTESNEATREEHGVDSTRSAGAGTGEFGIPAAGSVVARDLYNTGDGIVTGQSDVHSREGAPAKKVLHRRARAGPGGGKGSGDSSELGQEGDPSRSPRDGFHPRSRRDGSHPRFPRDGTHPRSPRNGTHPHSRSRKHMGDLSHVADELDGVADNEATQLITSSKIHKWSPSEDRADGTDAWVKDQADEDILPPPPRIGSYTHSLHLLTESRRLIVRTDRVVMFQGCHLTLVEVPPEQQQNEPAGAAAAVGVEKSALRGTAVHKLEISGQVRSILCSNFSFEFEVITYAFGLPGE